MFIVFIIVVFLGNLVCGENGTEFIESLPEKEKAELLEKIGERISREVPKVRRSNASSIEVNETQMNEFDGLVGKILNEEKKYYKQKLIIKEPTSIKPTKKKKKVDVLKTQNLRQESKNDSNGDSKIITIPFRLHDSAVSYITNKQSVDTITPNEDITEKDSVLKSTSNENASQELMDTKLTSASLTLDPATEKNARKSEESMKLVDKYENTTKDAISVETVISPTEETVSQIPILNDTTHPLIADEEVVKALTTDSPSIEERVGTPIPLDIPMEEITAAEAVTATIKESTTTQKSIQNDTINPLKSSDEPVSTEINDNKKVIKRTKERTQEEEAVLADEAKIMHELFQESTQNPIDSIIHDTIGQNGEKDYSINENNETTHKDEAMIKIRRHTNSLGTQNIFLQPSRRSGSNNTYSSEILSRKWSQDQRIKYLRNSKHSNKNHTNNLDDSNINNNESVLNKSESNTSESNNSNPQLHDNNSKEPTKNNKVKSRVVNKKMKKSSKKINRQNLGSSMEYSDESLSDEPEYPNGEPPFPFGKNFYTKPKHNTSTGSLEVLQNLLKDTVLNNTHHSEEKSLLEDTTHIFTKPPNSFIQDNLNTVATTSFPIYDETTPKFVANKVETIKLPINTTEDKKESLEHHYKILTEVARPLKPKPPNNSVIPPELVESLAYPKIKKKNKHNRKPLKLHITSGHNPVNIKIFYDKSHKKPNKLKISVNRDNIDYSIPDNHIKFNNRQWPRRNFGDSRGLYLSDIYPPNNLEYTTIPSYFSYGPPVSYQPTYYKPEIPYTIFSKQPTPKRYPYNGFINPDKKQETYVLNNGADGKYFQQIGHPNIPQNLAFYKGQFQSDDTNKLATQKILREITKFLDPDTMKPKGFQKLAIRNDRYQNPLRCRFGKSGRSRDGDDNSAESDCRNSDEDDNVPVNEVSEDDPKLITLIAVMSKNKPKIEVEDPVNKANAYPLTKKVKKVAFKQVLLDPASYLYKQQQEMYKKDAVAHYISSKSHVDKEERHCPKLYNIDTYVESIGMMVINEDDALRRFDWLGSTIDIQGAIQKLIIISNKYTTKQYIYPADLELLKFVIYLRKLAIQRGVERKNCRVNKNHVPVKEPEYKVMQKADWMLYGRTNRQNMNKDLYNYYNNQNNEDTEILEFISFLNVLQTELYDLHSVIKQISGVTKYNNQNWFGDIKSLYLDYANRQDLLGVLLHLSMTKIIDYIEDSANKGLTYNYIQYVIDHQQEILDIVDEFDFCSILTNEMEKNIVH